MNHQTAARLSDAKWRGASDEEVRSLVRGSRFRGDEAKRNLSTRGFGYRRCRNEVVPNQTAYRDGWFYDTQTVAAGAAMPQMNFFAVAQGAAGKTLAQTNLTGQGGQLPSGNFLMIRSIRLYISNTTVPADLQNIITNCSAQFKVNQVPIYQHTPGWFPAGYGGVTLAAANVGTVPTGSSVVASQTNGMPWQSAAFTFNYPYSLESQLNFVFVINPETAFNLTASSGVNPVGVGTSIVVTLEGDGQRIVIS